MAGLRSSIPSLSLRRKFISPFPKGIVSIFISFPKTIRFESMSSTSNSGHTKPSSPTIYNVPELDAGEIDRIADQNFKRYASSSVKRKGNGIAIVWFRNDLRVLDNEVLFKAWVSSKMILPVYCVDPRLFGTTHYFGFPKTGALRAQFIFECLADLKKNLLKLGLNLLIQQGKPEDILPALTKTFGAHTVYAQKETCSEELTVERLVSKGLLKVVLQSPEQSNRNVSENNPKLQLVWGSTMYHMDDLPFDVTNLPDVYTQFRKAVEAKSKVRSCIKMPSDLGPSPSIDDWGSVPCVDQFGLLLQNVSKGLKFMGGESAAMSRVNEYFWKKAGVIN